MSYFKEHVERRNEMTKYLEHALFSDAAMDFYRYHANISKYEFINNDWAKYYAFATRIWLNYLDNNQFEQLIKKKLGIPESLSNNYFDFLS